MENTDFKYKTPFLNRLSTVILSSFIILCLVPLMIIIFINYRNGYQILFKETKTALMIIAAQKSQDINRTFDHMLTDLKLKADSQRITTFLTELSTAYENYGKSIQEFTRSSKWAMLVDNQALDLDLDNFRRSYGYHDILLLDTQGNVLYNVARENDLGANLFSGETKNSRFSHACKTSLDSGDYTFSDFERYALSQNNIFAFLTAPVMGETGETIGIIAFQFPISHINTILDSEGLFKKSAQIYMVGRDLKLRSELSSEKGLKILETKIETRQTLLWKKHHHDDIEFKDEDHHSFSYKNIHGIQVLGAHNNIDILGIPFGIVVEMNESQAFAPIARHRNLMLLLFLGTILVVTFFGMFLSRRIVSPILKLSDGAFKVSQGSFDSTIDVSSRSEVGHLTQIFNTMISSLKISEKENEQQRWMAESQVGVSEAMHARETLPDFCSSVLSYLAKCLNAQTGTLYIINKDNTFDLKAAHALESDNNHPQTLKPGQGLAGQAVKDQQAYILDDIPESYLTISSTTGNKAPAQVIIMPVILNREVICLLELGRTKRFEENALPFLELISESIAIAIQSLLLRLSEKQLLQQTQVQHEELLEKQTELEAQQNELKKTNDVLEQQKNALLISETNLKEQQVELQQTNEELEEQAQLLEEQKEDITNKNSELEQFSQKLEAKTEQLEISTRYKSEFLANMSHELRTPLNSILLLSRLLSDNRDGGLSKKEMEFAGTIYSSGNDLLELIKEILDLSKIEAGKVQVTVENVNISDMAGSMKKLFAPIAQDKGIDFSVSIEPGMPESISTDQQRLEQILKNLLSNAVKFTSRGSVSLKIGNLPQDKISFAVSDTGIGIEKDKQQLVFESFKQVDGSTDRKFGGTGLGLSISRELVKLLKGDIQLESETGKGSVFILTLPLKVRKEQQEPKPAIQKESVVQKESKLIEPRKQEPVLKNKAAEAEKEYIPDDKDTINDESKSILVIEDDQKFATILCEMAREKGFKVIAAESGEVGLHYADYYKPKGILLDIGLPGIDGWTVMARLKESLKTKHIPIHILSGQDRENDGLKMGAVGFFVKPVSMDAVGIAFDKLESVISNRVKQLLVVEGDENQQKAIKELIGNSDVMITKAMSGKEALSLLKEKKFDCMILDLALPDMAGLNLLSRIRSLNEIDHVPVIVYTGRELTADEKAELDNYSEKIIIKDADTYEALFAQTTLFLHRVAENLPADKLEMLKLTHNKENIFKDKKILVADDDMRNVFALSSALEGQGMKIMTASNGVEAVQSLKENPDVDLVLMDIMMPEMDGYEATKKIRLESRFKKLPIIALTAKAMKGDRNQCIKAGASDYLSKPVNTDKLLSMMRVWLY